MPDRQAQFGCCGNRIADISSVNLRVTVLQRIDLLSTQLSESGSLVETEHVATALARLGEAAVSLEHLESGSVKRFNQT